MIICGLPNEEWAQKRIQNIAQYIINQKTKGRGPKHAGRLQRACGTHSASRRGTLELAGWQGVLLPREFTSVAAAEHGQHTWSVVWGREMGLDTLHLRRWWWLSQAAGGTKASCFVHGKVRSDPGALLVVLLLWERVWCKQRFSSSKMQIGLESQYLVCRYFSKSFTVNFRRLNISSTDVYEQKWYNPEQWLSLNNLIRQLWNKLSALNSSADRSSELCSNFIGNLPYVDNNFSLDFSEVCILDLW